MLRPDAAASGSSAEFRAEFERIALPLGPARGGQGGFRALMGQVQDEVRSAINSGFGSDFATPAMNSAGAAWLASRGLPSAALSSETSGVTDLTGIAAQSLGAPDADQQAFLTTIAPWAEQTGQQLGVAPHLVAAHAALESGWGARPLRQADGSDTHNLFGIKAGSRWAGDSAAVLTTEYVEGSAVKQTERFRAYPDYASAFRDYAQMLQGNPRFAAALGTGTDARAFAEGLARGGYATDPAYANKLARVAGQIAAGQPPSSTPAAQRD